MNMNNNVNPGFVNDLSQLDLLRKGGIEGNAESLHSAAKQFESVFVNMLFKSMRSANDIFKSDLMDSSTVDFYKKMQDEQMASEMSSSNSLGLADLIVKQLGGKEEVESIINRNATSSNVSMPNRLRRQYNLVHKNEKVVPKEAVKSNFDFSSPQKFVKTLIPFAKKAAKNLGIAPEILIAQAALETGWGKKIVKNSLGSSLNLFNIKADPNWKGEKIATKTMEVYKGIAVQERAAFRSYSSIQDSFNDYVNFIKGNPRYGKALLVKNNANNYIKEIHTAGYATDPNYASKVINIQKKVLEFM